MTAMSTIKGRQVFQEKIEGWHPQLPLRVSPTLVTPLACDTQTRFFAPVT